MNLPPVALDRSDTTLSLSRSFGRKQALRAEVSGKSRVALTQLVWPETSTCHGRSQILDGLSSLLLEYNKVALLIGYGQASNGFIER